jgi:hypothetical protein
MPMQPTLDVHDAEFLLVPCPFAMYESLRTGAEPDSPTVVNALAKLPFPNAVSW